MNDTRPPIAANGPPRRADSALGYLLHLLERYRYWILAAAALWMLAGVNGNWRIASDTTFYATIARNLVEGHGYVYPGGDAGQAWPGIVYLLGANFWLFGTRMIWPAVVANTVMGLVILGLTYRLIALHADRAQAVASTCLLALSANFYRQSLSVLADLPFVLGLLAFLVGYEQLERRIGRRWVGWLALAGGLLWMSAFKITVIVVIGAWLVAEGWKAIVQRRRWVVLPPLGAMVVLALVRWFYFGAQSGQDLSIKAQQIIEQLWIRLGLTLGSIMPANALELVRETLPEAVFGNKLALAPITITFSLIVLAVALVLFARRLLWGLLVVGFVLQWLVFFPDGRYILVLMPLLAFAWWRHAVRLSRLGPSGVGWTMFVFTLTLWVGMNLPRTMGVILTQHRQPFYAHYEQGRYLGLLELSQWMEDHTPAKSRVLTRDKWAGPLTFFSRRLADPSTRSAVNDAAAGDRALYWVHLTDEPLAWRFLGAGLKPGPNLIEIDRGDHRPALTINRLRRRRQ